MVTKGGDEWSSRNEMRGNGGGECGQASSVRESASSTEGSRTELFSTRHTPLPRRHTGGIVSRIHSYPPSLNVYMRRAGGFTARAYTRPSG